MSAITGIFYRDGRKVEPDLIKKMNDKLSHRGPDGSAVWCEGSVALGHQMLWTTPESLHEKLPFHDEEAGLVIAADARIDNRKELSEELDIDDKEDVSDSYFILKAYEKWGEKCPEFLLGDFAFAIWDENDEKLFCARAHWGIKPFYYYLDDNQFIFSSEIKAIFSHHEVPREINELNIAYYIGLVNGLDREITFYNGIVRLPAANSLTIYIKKRILKEYWSLDPNFQIHLDTNEEYEKAFLNIFTEAVNCRLRSAFPVGSMLSGGLDSSSVACTAQKILKFKGLNSLRTFSATFDSIPKSNERDYIEKVLQSSDFDPYYVLADKISPLNEINDFFWYRDQPLIVPNTFMNWNIFREAGKHGVRVLLDGYDGDIIVSHGNGYLTELFCRFRWRKFVSEINALRRMGKNSYSVFFEVLVNILPKSFKKRIFIWREYYKKEGSRTRIVKKDFANSFKLIEKAAEMMDYRLKIDNAHKKHFMSLKSPLLQWEMELFDALSIPFHVEHRHPFYDVRLVEFCLAIPTEQKIFDGWDRFIMRRSMKNILPVDIQWRKNKGNLSFNFKHGFMSENEILDDVIIKNTQRIEKYVDINELQDIYTHCKSGNTKNTLYLWHAVILSLWLKNFEDMNF